MSTPPPSIAELRAATQPATLFERHSGEHWAGRLYMRRFSPYVTRLALAAGMSADGVTALMIPCGLLAAFLVSIPGIVPAVGAVALIQLQLLLDCSDGEVARWRRRSSPAGIYLDRIGHHVTEAALPCGLGVRADGGWDSLGGWTTLGLLVAVLVLLIKSETSLVYVARAAAGRAPAEDRAAVAAPRGGALRSIRQALGYLPFFRAFVAMEATLLALAAAIADSVAGDHRGSRVLLVALVAIAALTAVGHLVATLASRRLD